MIKTWEELTYWQSLDWQIVQEKLYALDAGRSSYNPDRHLLFAALDDLTPSAVRVFVVGQDPYPKKEHATGVAFSIPEATPSEEFPPTLRNIFQEYVSDLKYNFPTKGDLTPWVKQGVMLWNLYPSCQTGVPGSHRWSQWETLTREIIQELDTNYNIVFVLLGVHARKYAYPELITKSEVIETSHPSPLGARRGFIGSRLFSSINALLKKSGREVINWRLP